MDDEVSLELLLSSFLLDVGSDFLEDEVGSGFFSEEDLSFGSLLLVGLALAKDVGLSSALDEGDGSFFFSDEVGSSFLDSSFFVSIIHIVQLGI